MNPAVHGLRIMPKVKEDHYKWIVFDTFSTLRAPLRSSRFESIQQVQQNYTKYQIKKGNLNFFSKVENLSVVFASVSVQLWENSKISLDF